MSKKITTVGGLAKTGSRKKEAKPRATKVAQLEAMLRRPVGATVEQLGKALGWQTHSVRGAISGSLKKKGISVSSEQQENGPRVYHIV